MKIRIEIISDKTRVVLLEGKKESDSVEISDLNRLSETLLLKIDELLRRNKLETKDISKFETKADIPDTYTSVRIIEATAQGLNFRS